MDNAPVEAHGTEALRDVLQVSRSADVVVAGALATDRCLTMGYAAKASRAVGIAAAELASNIVRHAGSGTLSVQVSAERVVLEATDRGPGIQDVQLALRDHYSQGLPVRDLDPARARLGCGLGAVARLMDRIEFGKTASGGAVVRATLYRDRSVPWW